MSAFVMPTCPPASTASSSVLKAGMVACTVATWPDFTPLGALVLSLLVLAKVEMLEMIEYSFRVQKPLGDESTF